MENPKAYSAIVDDNDDDFSQATSGASATSASSTSTGATSGDVIPAASNVTSKPDRRALVMTGPLPDDFLQMESTAPVHQNIGYQQPVAFGGFHQSTVGIVNISVVQARLAKNYGMTRMDPFCRVRIGVMVFETPTAYNGSKTPRWNKIIQSQLPPGVKEFLIEVYDERTFSMDEKIAWGIIPIKEECFQGQTVDEWYPLTGKQGDGKEGMIQIIIQYKKGVQPIMMNPMMGAPLMIQQPTLYGPGVVYGYPQMMYQQQQQPAMPTQVIQQSQQLPTSGDEVPASSIGHINEKDLKALKEMCPSLDDDIIRSVYQQSGENLDRAAAQLIEMSAS